MWLHHYRLVRQFIAFTGLWRKIHRQLPRHGFDSLDDPGLKVSRLEISLHIRADLPPALAAYMSVDAAIGDDLDLAVGEQEIDQHAVVVGGGPDPQVPENIQRAVPRRLILEQRPAVQRAFDDETDLAGMRGLARLDRPLDRDQHLRRKNPPHPPMVLEQ